MNMELLQILNHKNLKYLFYLLLITIAVYFCNTLFIFYMNLRLTDYSPAGIETIIVPQQKTSKNHPLEFYNMILERNLFSVKTDETDTSTGDFLSQIDKLVLTSLNCTLIGTIINEGGNSWAIIKDNNSNRQDRYGIGSVMNGAKIVIILRNKVVLNIDGKDELLIMGIEKIRAEDTGEKSEKGSADRKITTYKISKNFIKEGINNVARIMSKVRIKPYFKNGKPQGFKIIRIKKGSIFKTMGFMKGDIIRNLNGRDIHSAEDIMKLYSTLKDSSFFSITILRNNQARTLNFKVR